MAARHSLDSQLRALHDAGEPIYGEDFIPPLPAPGENAADDLLAAGEIAMRQDAAHRAFDQLSMELPLTEKEIVIITEMVESRRAVFPLIQAAARKPAICWRIDCGELFSMQDNQGLDSARTLANLLKACALLAHQQGRERAALERIEQIFMIARAVDWQPSIVAHLVALGIGSMASNAVEQISYDLQMDGSEGVTPSQVRSLIAELLDETDIRAGMVNALRGERMSRWTYASNMSRGEPSRFCGGKPTHDLSSMTAYFVKPQLLGEASLLVRVSTRQIHEFETSTDAPTFAANANIDRNFPQIHRSPVWHFLSDTMTHGQERQIRMHYQAAADRRLTAIALAARCFSMEHGGALPATLEELAPRSLPALPSDPMAPGGVGLRYRGGGVDPLVYSIGTDGIDEGGSEHPIDKQRHYQGTIDRWQCEDAVLHLKRQPRPIETAYRVSQARGRGALVRP